MTRPTDAQYQKFLDAYRKIDSDAIAFGHTAIKFIEAGWTIRQMSMDLCGNYGLEDRLGRYIAAAKWDALLQAENGQLYEDVRTWLSPSHFAALYGYYLRVADLEAARDETEKCLIRNSRKQVVEVVPVQTLRGRLLDPASPSVEERQSQFVKIGMKFLADMQSKLESLGKLATRGDRRKVRLLSALVKEFAAAPVREGEAE